MSVYFALLAVVTLLSRESGLVTNTAGSVFRTWQILGRNHMGYDVLFNALLFLLEGVLLAAKMPKKLLAAALCVLTSLVVEYLQFKTGRGLFEIADLLNNTLGGACGVLLWSAAMEIKL